MPNAKYAHFTNAAPQVNPPPISASTRLSLHSMADLCEVLRWSNGLMMHWAWGGIVGSGVNSIILKMAWLLLLGLHSVLCIF
jgi:hypothetical protein